MAAPFSLEAVSDSYFPAGFGSKISPYSHSASVLLSGGDYSSSAGMQFFHLFSGTVYTLIILHHTRVGS